MDLFRKESMKKFIDKQKELTTVNNSEVVKESRPSHTGQFGNTLLEGSQNTVRFGLQANAVGTLLDRFHRLFYLQKSSFRTPNSNIGIETWHTTPN